MNILNQVNEIIDKYCLKPIDLPYDQRNLYTYLNDFPEKKSEYISEKNDRYFREKYSNYISNGYYGFSIGTPIIPEWNEIIDEILELCIKNDPNFEIKQIKIKFGIMHFYVHTEIIEDIFDVEILIMEKLRDRMLLY